MATKQSTGQILPKISNSNTKTTSIDIPAGIYSFNVNNGNIRTMCEICSKLTIKAPERRHDVVLVSQDLGLAILQNLHAVADDFLGTFRIC